MTAFARSEATLDDCQLVWEIRTVNHRYLDINIKLPEEIRQLDTKCRQLISGSLNRGRVDAILKLEKGGRSSGTLNVNKDTARSVSEALTQIQKDNPSLRAATSTDVLRWPGVLQESQSDQETLHVACSETLETALSDLVADRKREGQRLGEILLEKADQCEQIRANFVDNISDIQGKTRQKWQSRIEAFATNVEPERMAQEIAILLTKSDVVEELDRLQTHLEEIRKLLQNSKPSGRSLDFLMQELNREANTLGSKSIDERMTNASIDLKVLIDQMREQVQNIE
jgi:uncharacterized protein (TIGR00255 family)